METTKRSLFEIHAAYCRVLANPTRLMILDCLKNGEMSVSQIAMKVEAPMSTVSQHLKALSSKQILLSRKDGQMVYYRPADMRILEACQLIRKILLDGLKKRGEIAMEFETD